MLRVHKVALDPTNKQASYFAKASGTARFAYNWALAWWRDAYNQWKVDPTSCDRPNEARARLHMNMEKDGPLAWMYEVTKCAPQEAVRDLGRAFTNFFAGRAGFPKFHKKGINDAFRISSGFFAVKDKVLKVPNLGWVRMRESLRWPNAKLLSVTISKRRGRWFASISCELPDLAPKRKSDKAVGVDVGTGEYATSDGDIIQVPRAYRRCEKQLRRAQKALSRKQKGSKNRIKAKDKVARVHGKVADIRANWLHQLTHRLVTDNTIIGIENLNVLGMSKNRHLAKSILDAGFYEFRRQLEYKAPENGAEIVVADRWFASSKICNECGERTNQLTSLQIRKWTCENCGASHHRDINAAINLKNYAVSSTVSACGEFSASDPPGNRRSGQAASMKQESDIKSELHTFE